MLYNIDGRFEPVQTAYNGYSPLEKEIGLSVFVFTFFLLSNYAIQYSQFPGSIAAFWPTSAILLGLLWKNSDRLAPMILISAYAGNSFAEFFLSHDLLATLIFPAINIIEVSISYFLLKHFSVNQKNHDKLGDLIKFFIFVCGFAAFVSATLASSFFWLYNGLDFTQMWVAWFMSDALGLILVAPIFLFFDWKDFLSIFNGKNRLKATWAWGIFLVTVSVIFPQSNYPIYFIAIPALLILSLVAGYSSAIAGIFCMGVIAFISSINGFNSSLIIFDDVTFQVTFLQVFLAVAVLTALPISAKLSDETYAHEKAVILQTAAETANRAKSEFLTSVSHELRTPLNAISGFSQLLELGQDQMHDKHNEYVKSILEGSYHLIKMVDDILELAKIENNKIELQPETHSIKDIMEKAYRLMKPIADSHNVSLTLCNDCHGNYIGDEARVLQILLNLVSNAIKYNTVNGNVLIHYKKTRSQTIIMIDDTGSGIETKYKEVLFEPFNRGARQQGNISGAGVGLAICKNLVEAMGGQIDFESLPEQAGTRFWFSLPLGDDKTVTPERDELNSLKPVGLKFNQNIPVLYVEDNKWNAKLLPEVLAPLENIEVFVAENGELGLDMAKKINPALIILDIHLPDIDGYDLVTRLRGMDEFRNTPIFALTADITLTAREKGEKAKFDEWVTKPFDMLKMQQLVSNAINTSYGGV